MFSKLAFSLSHDPDSACTETGSEIVAMAKSILIFSGVLLGASVGWYFDFAVIGAVVGATCGNWCAITIHLLDLPSRPTRSKPGLVQTPEQGLVKQWTKDEKQTPSTQQDQVTATQERPTHIQRLKNNRKYLDKSNHLVHKHDRHEKH